VIAAEQHATRRVVHSSQRTPATRSSSPARTCPRP
jgi:hypothetical protein